MKYYLFILLCSSFLFMTTFAKDQISLATIDVTLNSTKTNGKGWDVFKNAPDIALCVVTSYYS